MENFLFKIEATRNKRGDIDGLYELDFDGLVYELAAALSIGANRHDEIKNAVLLAADHIREEHRVKECQLINQITLN